jgi:hypothetical protein
MVFLTHLSIEYKYVFDWLCFELIFYGLYIDTYKYIYLEFDV